MSSCWANERPLLLLLFSLGVVAAAASADATERGTSAKRGARGRERERERAHRMHRDRGAYSSIARPRASNVTGRREEEVPGYTGGKEGRLKKQKKKKKKRGKGMKKRTAKNEECVYVISEEKEREREVVARYCHC